AGTAPVRGSGRNNLRQNLHLRRSPQPIASPPARTHHPQTRWPVRSRCNNEPPTSSAFWERSNDNAGRVGDHKFNPMVLSEIQTAADTIGTWDCSAPGVSLSAYRIAGHPCQAL